MTRDTQCGETTTPEEDSEETPFCVCNGMHVVVKVKAATQKATLTSIEAADRIQQRLERM